MKKFIITSFLFLAVPLYSQIDVSAGMGINYFNSASLVDYLNVNFSGGDRLQSFNTAAEFFLEGDYTINPNFQLGLEYAYSIYSYNKVLGVTNYDISVNYHKPSVLAYFIVPGKGYKFKLGGGLGYRYSAVTERIGNEIDYTSSGIGIILRAQGLTTLGDNLYALLSVETHYDINGEPSNGNTKIINSIDNSNINLNLVSFCFKIGIAYVFED